MRITIDHPPSGRGYQAHAWGDNGELVWWTEVYVSHANARHAIWLLQTEAPSAPVIDRT